MVGIRRPYGPSGDSREVKHIRKQGAPAKYTIWRNSVRDTADEDYRQLRNPLKGTLHRALLAEQGCLCAYTMKGICEADSHIEHIKPETLCRADEVGSDLEYTNLVTCFPVEGMKKRYRYGAQLKDDWWENGGAAFVSPLHTACEKLFRFGIDGSVSAVKGRPEALSTIEILGLNHPSLTDDRKRVINEFLFGKNGADPLSVAQATQAKTAVLQRNGVGCFNEFCVAIAQSREEYLKIMTRNAQRKRYSRRNAKNGK